MSVRLISRATRLCVVREHIADGYGVEDIAVKFGWPLHLVRYDVRALRADGQLRAMFPGKQKWGQA